jgi:predicted PurR-regulated permease PerM
MAAIERITTSLEAFRPSRMRGALWVVALGLIASLLYLGWLYVGTFIMGVFVYYVTRPVFRRINARVESRTLSVGLTLLVAAIPLLVIVGWALAILVNALGDVFDVDVFGELEALIQPYLDIAALFDEVLADPARLAEMGLGSILGGVVSSLGTWIGEAVTVGIHGFIVLIIVFYLLRDDYRIARWGRNTFVEEGGILESYFATVDTDLHNVYFGNILNALLTGLLAATVYTALNWFAPASVVIPQAAFLGILVGAASLVPVVGIKLVTWPVGGYLLVRALWLNPQAVWFPVLFFVVSFVIVDYIPDQLLRPYVSGRTLHVGAVMLAYTIGPLLFGWYGIFLAPFLFVVVFEFARLVFPWLLDPAREVTTRSAPAEHPSKPEPDVDEAGGDPSVNVGQSQQTPGPSDGDGSTSVE